MMNHFGTTDSNSVASTNQSVCNEQTASTNDQQLHLMINIEQPSGQTFHQNYLPTQVIEEHDTFVQQSTDANVVASSGNDPFGYYYDSTTAQLTPELSTPYQVDWNKVEFPISSTEIGQGENIQNEWSFHQETHQQPAQAQSIVSGGSGTIKISGDIFAGGVPNTFNQFDQTAASGQSIDSDQLLNNTPSPINASVQSATVPITTVASLEKGKKSGKRNQKNSGPNGQNGKGESRQTKPVSAYALFFRDTQSSIKTDNPSASFGEISKIVASKWELLRKEDKDVYKERADLEKRNYLQNLASNKAKEIASTCSNESNSPHQMNFIMTNSAELTGTPPPVLATEIVYGQSAESGMDMLQQVSSSDVDSAATLNSYTTFDFNQPASTQFHSGLNPVMSQTFDLGHQFDDEKVSPSFVFNDEASFFDTATESMIDLGIDLNDFDDINMLNEDIYSSNSGSVFDSTTVNPYMNQSQTVSGNEEPYTSGGTMLSAQPINGATNLYQCSVNDELRIPASIGHDYAENSNYVQDCSGSDQPESSLVNGGQVEIMNSRSAGLEVCARSGCQRQPVDSSEWDTEFCSEECCVRYCADVFRAWTSNKAFKPDPDSVQAVTSS